jgi:hypothetical protein
MELELAISPWIEVVEERNYDTNNYNHFVRAKEK